LNQINETSADKPHKKGKSEGRRPLYELILVMITIILVGLFIQEIKGLLEVIPLVYYFGEKRQRKRSWSELGVKKRDFIKDIAKNWYWFILVIFVIQISVFWAAYLYWPAFIEHILSRTVFLVLSPYPDIVGIIRVLSMLLIFTLSEEIIYRGLTQERLSWYYNPYSALFLTSFLFAAVHYYPGNALIILFDLLLVFADSLIYGLLYIKSHSIFISWTAHLAADIVGITILLVII
jgi:membrane protease YdiL (CAAX protease family)